MLRRIALFLISSFAFLLVTQPVMAAGPSYFGLQETAKSANYTTDDSPQNVYSVVQRVVSIMLMVVGIVFFLLMTYAGLRWMTARGNDELVAEAKNTLESAIIGLVVIVASYGITSFVFTRLGGGEQQGGGGGDFVGPPAPKACSTIKKKGECDYYGCFYDVQYGCVDSKDDVPLDNACQALKDPEICTNSSIGCFWSRMDGVCKKSTETPEPSAVVPDWCVVLRDSQEVSCEKPSGTTCSGGAVAATQADVDRNFICPLTENVANCPGFGDQEHCERVYGCAWTGDSCAIEVHSGGVIPDCHSASDDASCSTNRLCMPISTSIEGAGCGMAREITQCQKEAVNYRQDTCVPKFNTCKDDSLKRFNSCSWDTCHGGNDVACVENCKREQAGRDTTCAVAQADCYNVTNQALDLCIDDVVKNTGVYY